MSTFGAMVADIADKIGDDTDATTALIKRAVVRAIYEHRSMRTWFNDDLTTGGGVVTTSATVANAEYVSIPANLIEVDALRCLGNGSDPYRLEPQSWDWMESVAVLATNESSEPSYYCVRGTRVRLYPIPDASYTLYWSGSSGITPAITEDSADSVTNAWMVEGYHLINAQARVYLYRDDRLGEDEDEVRALRSLEDARRSIIRETNRRLSTGINRAWGC